MAFYRCDNGSGGSKVASGTFTTSTTGTEVALNFMPKQIWVSSAFNDTYTGSTQSTDTDIWSENGFIEYYVTASGTSAGMSKTQANKNNRFPSVTTNGFTHKARYGNKTAYYVAIG